VISKVLLDLRFSRNQAVKSVDDRFIGILKNKIKKLMMSYMDLKKQD